MEKGNLYKVFVFWLEQIQKLFALMKKIYIFDNLSLYHVFIGLCIFSILVALFKFGIRTQNMIRWTDNTVTYYNEDNKRGFKSFGNPRR